MITPQDFTRINNDVNGNPRYVCHFLQIPLTALQKSKIEDNMIIRLSLDQSASTLDDTYKMAVKQANKIGGKKYHTKNYGGGIVFQSYNLDDLCKRINELNK